MAQSVGLDENGMPIYGKLLDPDINNGILVVRNHPTVVYLLSTYKDFLLEQGLCKYSVFLPIDTDPAPMGGCQEFLGLPDLEGLLSGVSPHEVRISVAEVLVHKKKWLFRISRVLETQLLGE